MDKMRISEYAKQVGKKSGEIIGFINNKFDAGLNPRGYSKTLEKEWIKELNKHFKMVKKATVKVKTPEKSDEKIEDGKSAKRLIKRIIRHPHEDEVTDTQPIEEEKVTPKKEIKKTAEEEIKKGTTSHAPREIEKKEKPIEDKKPLIKKREEPVKNVVIKDKKDIKGLSSIKGKPKIKTQPKYHETEFEEVKTIEPQKENTVVIDEKTDVQLRKKKKKKKKKIDKEKIAKSVEETIKSIRTDQTASKKKYKDKTKKSETDDDEVLIIKISDYIILSDLAEKIDEDPVELIKKAIEIGIMVTINQRLDYDNASIIAMEFGYEVERIQEEQKEEIVFEEDETETVEGEPRPPVVTVMGHVDHGKTTLIDYLRESRIVDTEHGKITQNIGAYTVKSKAGKITVVDTPGHEAFTAMRARGAQVTDIAIIVIAANDSVMPQTKEAINHANLANIPFIIAINKIDLPESDPEKVKRDLLNENIVVEDFGGKIPVVAISAKTGKNVNDLIETVLLQAELMELKAPVEGVVKGVVIEVKQDKGLGPVINCIIQKGTLHKSDVVVAGSVFGKVRKLLDEFGKETKEAGPSTPVTIVGLSDLPSVGDVIMSIENVRKAKDIARQRHLAYREQLIKRREITNVDSYERQLKDMAKKDLNLIIKGKVFGSIEALADSLQMLGNEEVKINVVYKEVGIVTENDVNIAIASDAHIIAFDTSISSDAKKYAKKEGISIKQYNIIYDVIDDIQKAILSMNDPVYETIITGKAQVRQMFKFSKTGVIAGSHVIEGHISRSSKLRIERDGVELGVYGIKSLKRFQDDVKKVESGFDCAVIIDGFDDIQENDIIIAIEERLIEPEI